MSEGQAVCRGKFGCGKGFQLFFVLSGLGNGSGVVGGEGAKGGEGTGDALFFGIGQGIMEIQGISRDLFFEDGLSKFSKRAFSDMTWRESHGKTMQAENIKDGPQSRGLFAGNAPVF